MKLKIKITKEKIENLEELNFLQKSWLTLLIISIILNFVFFVKWEYPPELLRFTIWVLLINAFIFIIIEKWTKKN